MNNVQLVGRLCKDAELKRTQSNKAYCNISIAVNREVKGEVDFISCIAWEKTAEMIEKYIHKGDRLGIIGTLRVSKYEKNGEKRNITQVLINRIEFLQDKKQESLIENKSASSPDEFPF